MRRVLHRVVEQQRLALRVLELSRSCHLRWSQPELVAPPPRTGAGRRVLFVGPTCYEDDVLGEWTTEPEEEDPKAKKAEHKAPAAAAKA